MDNSAKDHSDSDSGDSWTLLDNCTNYCADTPDLLEHPTASSTPENLDKDEDTDGISIISDSDPESSSPCSNNYEHTSQEYSMLEQPLPKFIPLNTSEIPLHVSDNSEKEEDDFLGETNGKHKTYVHRRNKRLSTVLNIIMLGSVITAAGVAIGHMWGAKTDCSSHPATNINKILSNLYKLQEENAYLRAKLKELTVYNIQTNQKTVKHNKCKKTYEEPLVDDSGKINERFTKCVDDTGAIDNKNLKSHMVEAISEKRILIGGKIPSQEGKKWVLEQKEKFLNNIQQKHSGKDSNNRDGHIRKKYKNDEYLNETKGIRYGKSYADSLKNAEKVKEINKRPYDTTRAHENDFDKINTNEIEKNKELNTKATYYKENYLKGDISSYELLQRNENSKIDNSKIDLSKKKDVFNSNDFIIYDKPQIKNSKDKNKTIKIKTDYAKNNEYATKNILKVKKEKHDRKKLLKELKDNSDFDVTNPQKFRYVTDEEMAAIVKESIKANENKIQYNFNNNHTPKSENNEANYDEYFSNFKEKKLKRKRETDSEEDLLKDDRYAGVKKKQERKKHDRQQSQKKVKRKNKYEQWEMKGGILKDFDDISETSSQEYENNLNKPNKMDSESNVNKFNDNKADKSIGTDNLNDKYEGHSVNTQNTKDEINKNEKDWLDERALFRKEARRRLEQEMFGNNISNTAGWYFRRMRKREQDREKSDNNTYKKVLKRNMNYKMKY